jgi:tetratricopeptide (TPR) repeat protein
MPTKKKESGETAAELTSEQIQAAYEATLVEFSSGIELLRKGEYGAAEEVFGRVEAQSPDEPEVAERARSYAKICQTRLAPPPSRPEGAEASYYQAVLLLNDGRADDAIQLLDAALAEEPNSVRYLYSRASCWGLKGIPDKAVSDLRQAIAVDPRIRFQAVNDPDFEKIREEPAFIDIIEPTPAGA